MNEDKTKYPFPNYIPEQINSIVVVITDDTIYDEKTEKQVGTILKDQTDANKFIQDLKGWRKERGFQIEASGNKESMIERFYNKSNK